MATVYRVLQQALANPIKIVPTAPVVNAMYKTPNFDESLFSQQFKEWENSSCYAQKYSHEITTAFQIHTTSDQDINLYLVNKYGRTIKDYGTTRILDTFPGNTYNHEGTEMQLYTATFIIDFENIPDDFYFIKLEVVYDQTIGVEPGGTYISEPIYVSNDGIDNTVLIEYSNDRIYAKTYFGNFVFRLRVEGWIYFDNIDSSDTQYNDEYFDLVLLNSYTFRKFMLIIGGVAGLPAWVIDKLNIIIGCSSFKVDSSYYTKGDGAKFSIEKTDKRFFASIELREQENYSDQTFVTIGGLIVMDIPKTKVAIRDLQVNGTNNFFTFIIDPNNITAFLNYLNSTFKTQANLLGIFEQQGTQIVYLEDPSENITSFYPVILDKSIQITHNPTPQLNLAIESNFSVVEWGDRFYDGFGTGARASNTFTHYYGFPNTSTLVNIYHQQTLYLLEFNNSTINGMGGDFPSQLEKLHSLGSSISYFDSKELTVCKSTIQEIILTKGAMTNFDNYGFDTWLAIKKIDLSYNNLDRGYLNSVVVLTDNIVSANPSMQGAGHSLIISNQTPLAPLYSTGTTAKFHLQSLGWIVTTD